MAAPVGKPGSGLSRIRRARPSLGLSFPFCKEAELDEKKGGVTAGTQALEPAALSLKGLGASLAAQWSRIHLPMQETQKT